MQHVPLFEIAVPAVDNAGKATPLFDFETALISIVRGFTKLLVAEGTWVSPEGKTYVDSMQCYRVACSADRMREVIVSAARIFADQEALFVSEIGRAWIVPTELCTSYPARLYNFTYRMGT